MNKIPALLLCLFWNSLFFSCQDLKYEKQNLPLLREVLLLQVNYHSQSLHKNNKVQYPYDEFVCESFVKSFVSNFNLNTNHFKIKAPFLDLTGNTGQNQKVAADLLQPAYLREQKDFIEHLGIMGLIDQQKIPAEKIKKLLTDYQASSYLVLDFQSSVWQQDFMGSLQVFSATGEQVFHYGLKNKNSKYIIYDSNSPYVIRDNEFFKQKLDPTSTHTKEIRNIYRDLGKVIAEDLKKVVAKLEREIKKLTKATLKKKQKHKRE